MLSTKPIPNVKDNHPVAFAVLGIVLGAATPFLGELLLYQRAQFPLSDAESVYYFGAGIGLLGGMLLITSCFRLVVLVGEGTQF